MSSKSLWQVQFFKTSPESFIQKPKTRHFLWVIVLLQAVWGPCINSPQFACTLPSHRRLLRPGASASCGCCAPWRWGPRNPAGGRRRRPSAWRTCHGGTHTAAASTALLLLIVCDASESTEGERWVKDKQNGLTEWRWRQKKPGQQDRDRIKC